jgi:hypothetical protein
MKACQSFTGRGSRRVREIGIVVNTPLATKQVVANISNDLSELERLFLDELSPFERFGAEMLKLHQFSIRENHSYTIIQIMKPFS